MRGLVRGKNTIGQMAAVLKKPYKATFTFYLFYLHIKTSLKGVLEFHATQA